MNKYNYYKEKARQKAIYWQIEFSKNNYSYYELLEYSYKFYKLGRRYGLIKEFRENGVI